MNQSTASDRSEPCMFIACEHIAELDRDPPAMKAYDQPRSHTSRDLERSPHAVENRNTVDVEVRGIAGRGREYIAFDVRQAEAELLIEAQEPRIRRCGGHEDAPFSALARMRDPRSCECSTEPDAATRLEDREALELCADHLDMPDDRARVVARDENIAEIAISGDRALRVIGEPEQRCELGAVPGVELDHAACLLIAGASNASAAISRVTVASPHHRSTDRGLAWRARARRGFLREFRCNGRRGSA